MKEVIQKLPRALETEIDPNSLEWSAGQRQLFCIARCLLEGRKLVLLDEPTASLDNA